MGNVTTVGIDLAKNVFSLHGVDELGRSFCSAPLRRAQVGGWWHTAAVPDRHGGVLGGARVGPAFQRSLATRCG